jgi:nitrate/nitrite transporter NarK
MIALRALRLTLIVFVLLCIVMTLMAVLLGTGHPQTTLTPGVVSPTPSSPTGLPEGPTFSTCSYACNSQYLACVNPCSTAAGIAAGTGFTDPNVGARAQTTVGNTTQCFSNCTNLRQTCTLGCSGLPFD